jgi:uncharacterized OsmC-like protein
MQDLPHLYRVSTSGGPEGDLLILAEDVEAMLAAPPPEFGGPRDRWSPETLLVASVSSCFVLSFRAIARASRLPWTSLEVHTEGKLERVDGGMRFTKFEVNAILHVPPDTHEHKAHRIMEKAEETCLITNSMTAETRLNAEVRVEALA